MLVLTYKAIARMSGYRIESRYATLINISPECQEWFWWVDVATSEHSSPMKSEADAWLHCCVENKLIDIAD